MLAEQAQGRHELCPDHPYTNQVQGQGPVTPVLGVRVHRDREVSTACWPVRWSLTKEDIGADLCLPQVNAGVGVFIHIKQRNKQKPQTNPEVG